MEEVLTSGGGGGSGGGWGWLKEAKLMSWGTGGLMVKTRAADLESMV